MSNNFGSPIMDTIKVLPNAPEGSEKNRKLGIDTACKEITLDGDWAEFGVYQGTTARWLLNHIPDNTTLHLFDSFEGLAREWSGLGKGFFKTKPPVFDDSRVEMYPGWFIDTVHNALHDKELSFLHIDCDLYESTVDVLNNIPKLRPGTIILFDEYVHNLANKPVDDEHRAFTEWIVMTGHNFEYLWRTAWTQVCVRIL
jgi:predicted O-methyltransferase YrrM